MFDLSVQGYCSQQFPLEDFIESIGDSNVTCRANAVKFPINGRIIYKPVESSQVYYFIEIKVYTEENNDECKNINVFTKLNLKEKVRICEKIEYENLSCKYSCKLKEKEEIVIFLKSYPQKLCDIQVKSKKSLINVCV